LEKNSFLQPWVAIMRGTNNVEHSALYYIAGILSLTVYVANTYGINVGLSDKTLKGRRRPDLLRSRLGISCWEKLRRCDSRELIPFLHCNCLQLLDTAAGVGFGWRSFWRL